MADYTRAVDEQISRLLDLKGHVSPEMVAGFDTDEAIDFLSRYADLHAVEMPLTFDGHTLLRAAPAHAAPQATPPLSPVDQIVGMERGGSLLDTAPSAGKVPGWLWVLPLTFALPGGLIAWLLARDNNRQVALALWWTGVAVTVLTVVAWVGKDGLIGPQLAAQAGVSSAATRWAPSESGLPTFYYFGSAETPESAGMRPVIDVLSRQYSGRVEFILYADISADKKAAAYARAHGVGQTPTMVLVSPDGTEKTRWVGEQAEPVLSAALDSAGD